MPELSLLQRLNAVAQAHPEFATTIREAMTVIDNSTQGRETEYARHKQLLNDDPDYARRMETLKLPTDRNFTVSLELVDEVAGIDIYQSLFSKSEPPMLIAGCRVHRIDFYDMGQAFENMKGRMSNILNTSIADMRTLLNEPPKPS